MFWRILKFSSRFLDERKSRVLLNPNISLVKLHDEESSLGQVEWCWSDGQENFSLVFKLGGGLEGRMIFEFFFLVISQEEKSKVLMDPEIFFNDLGIVSSFGWLSKSKEEEWIDRGLWQTLESCSEEDGLISDSNDDLDRFPNVVLVD